jgi:hypothetical protein
MLYLAAQNRPIQHTDSIPILSGARDVFIFRSSLVMFGHVWSFAEGSRPIPSPARAVAAAVDVFRREVRTVSAWLGFVMMELPPNCVDPTKDLKQLRMQTETRQQFPVCALLFNLAGIVSCIRIHEEMHLLWQGLPR